VGLTTDRNDKRLRRGRGVDTVPIPQHDTYLVLSEEELAKGFVRPVQQQYVHSTTLGGCGAVTHMGLALSETYARDPGFYYATYCVGCNMHKAVGANGEFIWDGTDELVGT
jgi:hypothetical protein